MTAHPLFDISGRTALVTGSSRGIGLAPARGLAEAGCTVVLNGRDTGRLAEAAADLPGEVRTAVFDVTDGPAVAAGIADIEERVGPLDILVNNAGMRDAAGGADAVRREPGGEPGDRAAGRVPLRAEFD